MRRAPHNVEEFRQAARRRLPKPQFDFIEGGAEDEATVKANRDSFAHWRLVPKPFTDVSQCDLSTTVGGLPLKLPIMLSPTGQLGLVHPIGELGGALAAARCGTIAVVSGHGTYSLEEVAAAAPDPGWFNLFPWGDRSTYGDFADRAAAAGYSGICLTLDTPVAANRERDIANGWTAPPRLTAHAVEYARHPRWVYNAVRHRRTTLRNFDPRTPSLVNFIRRASQSARTTVRTLSKDFGWADLEWLRRRFPGVLAVKGAFSPADAERMAACGVDVLYLGNHGGRQLDGVQSALELLPPVAAAVGRDLDIVLDGGVRRGTDVIKALALGARACSIGRPWVYGLACGGAAGAEAVLRVLERELLTDMTLLGAASVRDLDRSYVTLAGFGAGELERAMP